MTEYEKVLSMSHNNQFDPIEKLIMEECVYIEALTFYPKLDMMLVILNTKAILHQNLSSYPGLKMADKTQLLHYELIGGGTGIHWPILDEDLSLKGLLQNELRKIVS